MKELRVSNRYAASLLNLGIERNELENIKQDMDLVGETLTENRELLLMLKSPVIKPDTKSKILKSIFAGKVGQTVMAFLDIVVRKGREHLLFEVYKAMQRQYNVLKNITIVSVTTAVRSDDQMRQIIHNFISENKSRFGITGEVKFNEKVDPEIIGGFIIQAGDQQIDHSVKRKFDDLRLEFSKNPYIAEI